MMRILYSTLLLLANTISFAQKAIPELAADICNIRTNCTSAPHSMSSFNNKLFLLAYDEDSTVFYTYTPFEGIQKKYLFGNDTICYAIIYTVCADKIYFIADLKVNGITIQPHLCKWDGVSPPQKIDTKHLRPGSSYIETLNNKIYYHAKDNTSSIFALYEYDPTTDVHKKASSTNGKIIAGKIFTTTNASGRSIIQATDPITGNTTEVIENETTAFFFFQKGSYIEIDGSLYFLSLAATINDDTYLYKWDGMNPAVKLTKIPEMPLSLYKTAYLVSGQNGKIYFTSHTSDDISDLWSYDIKQNKLRQLTFSNVNGFSRDQHPILYNNKIIYDVEYLDTVDTYGLHIYDIATDSDWRMPLPFSYSTYFKTSESYVHDNKLYMAGQTDSLGTELYRYSEVSVSDSFIATLYPNPTTGIAHLNVETNTSQVFTLTILDVLGHTIMNKRLGIYPRGKHTIDIPLQHLAAGVYICTLRGSKNILYRGKLVKL